MKLSILLLAGLATTLSLPAATYSISVNSSSLSPGTMGFIDFAFNGGYPATAVVSNYSMTGGSLNPATITTQGTVSGTLPSTVTLSDNNAFYDEGLTFGSNINFLLSLNGTPSGSMGNTFTLSFYNSNFSGGLLTSNVNDDSLVQFQMDTRGNITYTAYTNPSGGPSFASVAAVPEPSSFCELAVALGAVIVGMRRRRTLQG